MKMPRGTFRTLFVWLLLVLFIATPLALALPKS